MSILDIILIGIALSMDAFALTVSNTVTYKKDLTPFKEWSMPIAFSLFQFLMPVLGYFIGSVIAEYISAFSGYVVAGIFFLLATKIVIDNVKESKENPNDKEKETPRKFGVLLLLIQAVATSIDALAVGVTFAASTLPVSFVLASLIIGIVTFILVAVALIFGKFLGKTFEKYAEWIGAVILYILAIKNIIEAII